MDYNIEDSDNNPYYFENEKDLKDDDDFDDVSTVIYSAKSFDSELEAKIAAALGDSFDSDTEDFSSALTCFQKPELKNEPVWQGINNEKVPEFECSKYIPKIGPKEHKYLKTKLPG